jgi:transposase
MAYWAGPTIDRDQLTLISTTLSDRIPQDHSVRLFWDLLDSYDWTAWEVRYHGRIGQPPIHPRIVAGVLLYGLTQGIRSSRRLEWACGHAVDFMWLAEGRQIDHATLCGFRREFGPQLKDLFRHLGRLAHAMGVVRLNCVAIDGTRVAACSSRHETRTGESIEQALHELDQRLETMLAQAEATDAAETATLFGEDAAPVTSVPKELASAKARQAKLKKALEELKRRQSQGSTQTSVAVADPEAPIIPNKAGGFAPNFTPVVATDAKTRYIVAETVLGNDHESTAMLPLLDTTEELYGQMPKQTLGDAGFSTPQNLEGLQTRSTDAYIAPWNERLEGQQQTRLVSADAAHRDDPRQPVAVELHAQLPRAANGRLANEAFLYDESADCYWCPMGRSLPLKYLTQDRRRNQTYERRVYVCSSCADCPLRSECTSAKQNRWIRRRGRQPCREAMAAKVHSEAGRVIYAQRRSVAESPFGIIKAVMGIRQFLLRGVDRVRTEWRWVCTAYNMRILVAWLRRQRMKLALN